MNPCPRSLRRVLSRAFFALPVSLVFPLAPSVFAADGTWILDGGGTWNPATPGTTLWSGNVVAQGADATADFSTIDITANRAVTLGAPVTIGNLKFGDTSGSQTWTLSGGNTLTLDTTTSTAPTITVNNSTATISAALAGNDGMVKAGAGRLILSGGHAFTGTIEVSAGTLDLWDTANPYTNNITLSASTATLDASNTASAPIVTVSGNISGSGRITKTGSTSTLVLTGNNNYSGGTTLTDGVLAIGAGTNNGIGTGTLTLNQGAFLATDNSARTIANAVSMTTGSSLRLGAVQGASTGLGDLTFTSTASSSIGASKTWAVHNATTVAFANSWTGNSGWTITKAGTGTLVFNGGITSTGIVVVVNAGTFLLNGTNSYNGATTVNAGTLGGSGSIVSAVTIGNSSGTSDAFLTGGSATGVGTFTTTNTVTMNSDAVLSIQFDSTLGTFDRVVTAGLTLNASSGLSLSDLGSGLLADGSIYTIVNNTGATSVTGTFAGLAEGSTITAGSNTFVISYLGGTGNDVTLTVSAIPEPSTYALLGGVLSLGLVAVRRRKRS